MSSLELSTDTIATITFLAGAALVARVVAFVVSLVRMPSDYFLNPETRSAHDQAWKLGRNVFGLVCLLAAFFLLPRLGPGALLAALGLSLVDFPGRARVFEAFVSIPWVAHLVNRLRREFVRPPLLLPWLTPAGS